MGVEYNQPAHLLDRYIKGGDINGGRLYLGKGVLSPQGQEGMQLVIIKNYMNIFIFHK